MEEDARPKRKSRQSPWFPKVTFGRSGMWVARGRREFRRECGFPLHMKSRGDWGSVLWLTIEMEEATKGRKKLGKTSPVRVREVRFFC